ncbi:hypothetical protein CYK37_21665 [Mesorhizobium loti]|nr:hypothetical protein [Mesorhizobium loti]PLP57291.1 hypothetical protein CYK37_21665 [Mesorhizobium loti]
MKQDSFLIAALVGFMFSLPASSQTLPGDGFNTYILKAVDHLYAKYPSKGYNISSAYTHEFQYGDGTVKSNNPPKTMCVAAVAEVISYALKFYVEETGDKTVMEYLPVATFNRMRPTDLRSHLWVDSHLASYGTADALVTFGIGKRVKFEELAPGSFLNINRNRPGKPPSGHAVVFIAYLDKDGRELTSYSKAAVGFKYWSAQGSGTNGDAGFAYRYAFLNTLPNQSGYCPDLGAGKKVDCWILNSRSSKMLNMGYMLAPAKWDKAKRDENFKKIRDGLYQQVRSKAPGALPFDDNISFAKFVARLDDVDTMQLNEKFAVEGANE